MSFISSGSSKAFFVVLFVSRWYGNRIGRAFWLRVYGRFNMNMYVFGML